MKIGIDARFAIHNRRGIGNYTLQLIKNLAEIDTENGYTLYTDREDGDHVLPQKNNFRIKKIRPANYFLWEQIALPIQAKKDALDILHCTGNTAPILLDKRIRLVTTIHDVMYLQNDSEVSKSASLYQRMGRIYRKVIVPKTVKRLSRVLTVSGFSKNDIMKHVPGLQEKLIKVTHEAANESYQPLDKKEALRRISKMMGIDGQYILTLGALDPRKNTELVIKIFRELKNELHIKEKLIIAGIPNWRQTKFYKLARETNLEDDILFADFISESDLVALYNGATLFLYPSLYEGFGIPPLEAMSCGVPVITSDTTSIPEIVGDAALLINPQNGEELKAAMLRALNDPDIRNELVERGFKRAGEFSWARMAKETLRTYQELSIHLR